MKTHKILKTLLPIFLLLALTACGTPGPKTATDMLQEMNIDQKTFSSMQVCLQIKIYTYVGIHYFDEDHFVVIMPAWVDEEIANELPEDVAACISQEGLSRLQTLSENKATQNDTTLAIMILISKASNLNIIRNPNIQELLNTSVCKSNLTNTFRIVDLYYLSRFGHFPAYLNQHNPGNVTKKMTAELCNP
jgi:predicted small lipoprotein YifL